MVPVDIFTSFAKFLCTVAVNHLRTRFSIRGTSARFSSFLVKFSCLYPVSDEMLHTHRIPVTVVPSPPSPPPPPFDEDFVVGRDQVAKVFFAEHVID